ncbi:MAG TPA: O-antigen ligase family protein [Gaiellaceae bacterium]|jgi:O-antigen ligase
MAARAALADLPGREDAGRRLAIAAGVVVSGVVVGAAAALSPVLAVAALVGITFVFVCFRSLPAGLAFFVVLTFFERLPGSPSSGLTLVKGAGLVLAVAWLASIAASRGEAPLLFRDHPWVSYTAIFFIGWSFASVLWAADSGSARFETTRLLQNLVLMFIVFTAISKREHLYWLVGAYLGGSFLTAVVGLAGGTSSEQFNPYADSSRLTGGITDPNELAALLIPALVIGAFLIPIVASPLLRWLLASLVLVLALALFFTQSRGGLLALAVVMVVTPFLAGPVRLRSLVVILMVAALGVGYFALVAPPAALSHVTHFSVGSGTGREDLWKVSIQMFKNHPVAGVGTGNFQVIEPRYAVRNLNLQRVDLVVDNPKVAHNTYLHILTELGVVGIIAFGGIIVGSLGVAVRAIRLLARRGERSLEILARGLLIGTLGMLAAFVFITAQYEKQLWLLLGACLALSTLARAGESESA